MKSSTVVTYSTELQLAALVDQGRSLHHQGRLAEAKAVCTHVLARQPKNFDALNLLGVLNAQEGNLVLAAELMGRALEVSPNEATLHFNCAAVLRQLKRAEEALTGFRRLVDIKPDFAEAHFHAGLCLQELNRTEEALTSFQRATAIQPDYVDAHFNLGLALQDLDRTNEALASFDHAIAIKPDFAQAHFNRGVVLERLKRAEEALQL
jgi:tetratricopeptide (TPR) repeat protein